VALELGSKRVFASAVDWPGWSRSAREEDGAIETLRAYAPRYAEVVSGIRGSASIKAARAFDVVERLRGGSGTNFGVPGEPPSADAKPIDGRELARLVRILRACWNAFDVAADAATGSTLRKGPRGGGRDLAKIRAHVQEADGAYLTSLGGRPPRGADHVAIRGVFVEACGARARGELPDVGPRGGSRWTARYAVRRSAWHTIDHAWEIEDRRT
jgi:hypothetical protein